MASGWKRHILLATAAVTCPCHIPVLAAILGGTALGGFLAEHWALAVGAASFLFAFSLGAWLSSRPRAAASGCGGGGLDPQSLPSQGLAWSGVGVRGQHEGTADLARSPCQLWRLAVSDLAVAFPRAWARAVFGQEPFRGGELHGLIHPAGGPAGHTPCVSSSEQSRGCPG